MKHPVIESLWERLPVYLEAGSIKPTAFEVKAPQGLRADVVNAVLDEYRDGKKVVKANIHL